MTFTLYQALLNVPTSIPFLSSGLVFHIINSLHSLVFLIKLLKEKIWANVTYVQISLPPLYSCCCHQQDNNAWIFLDHLGWRILPLHLWYNRGSFSINFYSGCLSELEYCGWEKFFLQSKNLHHKSILLDVCAFSSHWRCKSKRRRFKVNLIIDTYR